MNPQQTLQPAAIETDDDLIVDGDDRNSHPSCAGDQLLASLRIVGDVLGCELDAVRRKKLFRRVTGLSRRGPVDVILRCGISRSSQ